MYAPRCETPPPQRRCRGNYALDTRTPFAASGTLVNRVRREAEGTPCVRPEVGVRSRTRANPSGWVGPSRERYSGGRYRCFSERGHWQSLTPAQGADRIAEEG